MSSGFRERLISTALEKGYLDEDRVKVARRMLRAEEQRGTGARLHEILVRYNLMTREQLLEVRREMAREGIPMRIGDFDIVSRLGRGSTGTVYRARQRSLGREVALKILAEHLAADAETRERFFREARLAAKVTHENIVQIYDLGDTRHTHYFVMEYVAGRTLEHILEGEGRITEAQATEIGLQLARALVCMESCGIVHRDIKPGNIMITREGTTKLADLGMAAAGGAAGVCGGTAWYMPPEQARNGPAPDVRTDMYALGCTLFHAVSGEPPYCGREAAETLRMHAETPVPEVAALREDVSPGFSGVLRRMMAKRPEDRFGDASALLRAWEALAADEAPLVEKSGAAVGRTKRFGLWLVIAAAGAVCLLGLWWWLFRVRSGSEGGGFGTVRGVEFGESRGGEGGDR